jgi:hypothetical protein
VKPKVRIVAAVFLFTSIGFAAAAGSFAGKIVATPNQDPASRKWIYVQAAKGLLRRVDISQASIRYDPQFRRSDRRARAVDSLREGAEVRVTASQDPAGEWKATEITIEAPAR